jgi:hypothetical protein
VKALVHDFAAKEIHEDPGAAEEDYRPQDEALIDVRKDDVKLTDIQLSSRRLL